MESYTMSPYGRFQIEGESSGVPIAQKPVDYGRFQVEGASAPMRQEATSLSQKPETEIPFKNPEYSKNRPGMGGVYAARELPETELPEPLRTAARTGAQVAESVAGGLGDVGRLATGAVKLANKLSPINRIIPNPIKEAIPEVTVPEVLSNEGFRKSVTEPLLGKKNLEAKNDTERFMDDFVNFGTKALLPPFGLGAGRAAALAGTAAATGTLARNYAPKSWEEPAKALGVLGASLAAHKIGGKFPTGVMNAAYKDADAALQAPDVAKGLKLTTEEGRKAEGLIDLIEKELPKEGYNRFFRDVRKRIADTGSVAAEDLLKMKRALNENYARIAARGPVAAESFHGVRTEVKDLLQHYGKEFNPEFLKQLNKADEMYGAIKGAKNLSDFVGINLGKLKEPVSQGLLALTGAGTGAIAGGLQGGASGALSGGLGTAAVIGSLAGVHKVANVTSKALQAAIKSPEVRNAYGKLLGNVLRDNKTDSLKALNELNDALLRIERS
jgi:hypothetical protein